MSERHTKRGVARGVVERVSARKTLSVKSVRQVRDPRYHRYVRRSTVYKVHDEKQEARQGDVVEIMETRPVSKTKHWRLVRVVSRRDRAESEAQP